MRVERFDDYFAKTGHVALSNGPKMSQQLLLNNVHVLGIRAWPVRHSARRRRPGRAQVREMRGRKGWSERSALVHGYVVEKRELSRTLQSAVAKSANVAESKLLLFGFGRRRNVKRHGDRTATSAEVSRVQKRICEVLSVGECLPRCLPRCPSKHKTLPSFSEVRIDS